MVAKLKRRYVTGYKALQKMWKKESKELLIVGRLAYWTYWVSKLAESSMKTKEIEELTNLKKKAFIQLKNSPYIKLKKYVPKLNEKMRFYNEPVYILTVLDKKSDDENRNILFEMHMPYLKLRDEFPDLESLESVNHFNGTEIITVDVDQLERKVETNAFSKKLVLHYFKKNYKQLRDYFAENSTSPIHA